MKKKTSVDPKCIHLLSYGLGLSIFYPLFFLAIYLSFITFPMAVLTIYWGIMKLFLAYAILCIYQTTGLKKMAFIGLLLIISGLFSFFHPVNFIATATEALAIVGVSLILLDLDKAFPKLRLNIAGGLIFLGVIFSILNSTLMSFIGLLALLIGLLLSSTRLIRIRGKSPAK